MMRSSLLLFSSSVAVDMPFQVSLVAWQQRPQPRGDLAVGAAAAAQLLCTPTAAQIKAVAVYVGAVAVPQLHHL